MVLLINGSPNKKGECQTGLEILQKELLAKGIESEIVNGGECVNSCTQPFCVTCSTPCNKSCYEGTKMEEALEKMYASDFVVFATPVYFGTLSAQLKAFFDKMRLSRNSDLVLGKKTAAIAVGASLYGGQEGAINTIHQICLVMGMTIVGNASAGMPGHFGVRARRPIMKDDAALGSIVSLAARIAKEIE